MGLVLSLIYVVYLAHKEESISFRVYAQNVVSQTWMRFLWVLCGTPSLGGRVPFRSLLYELPYGIVRQGLKIWVRGVWGFFEPVCPSPVSLVRGSLWSGLVGFCIPLLLAGTDISGTRSPP